MAHGFHLPNNNMDINTIPSAAECNVTGVDEEVVNISGTTTITSLSSGRVGEWKILIFQGALTLTHNATNLILPGAANITTVAGDNAQFICLGGKNWRCVSYTRTNGFGSVPVSGTGSFTGSYNGTFTGSFNGTFTGSFTGSMDSPLNVGSLTGAVTFNVTGGNMQYGTLTGNVTATISMNQPQQMMRLFLSASGADRTITFAAGNYALQSSYVIGSGKASVFEIQRLNSLNYIFFSDYLTQI